MSSEIGVGPIDFERQHFFSQEFSLGDVLVNGTHGQDLQNPPMAVPMLAGLMGKGLKFDTRGVRSRGRSSGKGLQVDSVPRPYVMHKKDALTAINLDGVDKIGTTFF